MSVSVIPFSGVQIKLPRGISKKKALEFLSTRSQWLEQRRGEIHELEQKSLAFFNTQIKPDKLVLRNTLLSRLSVLAEGHGFTYGKVSIRNQKTRWGSCSGKNNISLNQNLFFLPQHLQDYVLLHELAHTIEKNHGPKFWAILDNIFGKTLRLKSRSELKQFSYLFFPPKIW